MIPFEYNRVRVADADAVDFFEFMRRYKSGRCEGIVIAMSHASMKLMKNFIRRLKFNRIENVGIFFIFFNSISMTWLDQEKFALPYLEVNVVDGCNLNCKGCSHFSPLFGLDEVYRLEDFERDMKQMSRRSDVIALRIVGGEPLMMKNLVDYLQIVKKYFPQVNLRILTNGVHILKLQENVVDYISKNHIPFDISDYPPMSKNKDRSVEFLNEHQIPHTFVPKGIFRKLLRRNGLSNPQTAMKVCPCETSRFLHNGRLYKCPIDALHHRFNEKFPNTRKLPESTYIDIFNSDLPELVDMLDEPVAMCEYCPENAGSYEWKVDSKPTADNWLDDK